MAEHVQRGSDAVQIQGPEAAQFRQYAAGAARPDFSGGTETAKSPRSTGLLEALLGTALQTSKQAIDIASTEAYLRGANAVNTVRSEEQLETNFLTRNFTVAGFRDTRMKFEMARKDAELQANMPKYAELSPEAFAEVLNQQRSELMQGISEMSLEQRQAATQKMVTRDFAAMQQHATARQEFVVQQQVQSISAGMQPAMQQLQAAVASGDIRAVDASSVHYANRVASDIWDNPNLPLNIKQSLTKESLELLLQSDNVRTYEVIDSYPGDDGLSMTQRLPLSDQVALAGKAREARKRVAGMRNMQARQGYVEMRHALKQGTFEGSTGQAIEYGAGLFQQGVLTQAEYEQFYTDALNFGHRQEKGQDVTQALMVGSLSDVRRHGSTPREGVASMVQQDLADGVPIAVTMEKLRTIGSNGFNEGFTELGNIAAPAVRNLMNSDGTVHPENAEVVQYLLQAAEAFEQVGQPVMRDQLLQGLPEEERIRMLRLMRELPEGAGSLDIAMQRVQALEREDKLNSTATLTARQGKTYAEATALLQEESEQGFLRRFGNWAISWVSPDAAARLKGKPTDRWFDEPLFSSDTAYKLQQMQFKQEVQSELFSIVGKYDFQGSPEDAYSMALQNVANRAVPTSRGMLYLPQGSNLRTYTGDQRWAGPEQVGEGLDRIVQRKAGSGIPREHSNSTMLHNPATGQISVQAWNSAGELMLNVQVSPEELRHELNSMQRTREAERDEQYGAGVLRYGQNKDQKVQFNGENAAGLPNDVALQLRENLVASEGVRNRVYKDSVGVLTVGVGLSEKNRHWPEGLKEGDIVPQEVTDRGFAAASSDAIRDAQPLLTEFGLQADRNAQLLFSEMAYQSGRGGVSNSASRELAYAIVAKDSTRAIAALRETNAYKYSGYSRRKHYDNLVLKSMQREEM